jgi:DNA-binding MarR family transcriptional regulator
VELGLVTRTRSETDRRVVTCRLTDAGREHVGERRAKFEGYWNEALAGFTASELVAAAAVLEQIATMFEGFDGSV